jgi:hypothetical protein
MVLKTPEITREMLQELQKFVQERWRRVGNAPPSLAARGATRRR